MQKDRNILFLCTGNSARSQMAEGLLRHYAGDDLQVYSAGLEPKGVNPYAIRALDELGIDIRGQSSKSVKEYMGHKFFHFMITLCSDAETRCPQALWVQGGKKLHWPFDDPAAFEGTDQAKLAEFRRIRDVIDTRIRAWLKELEAANVGA